MLCSLCCSIYSFTSATVFEREFWCFFLCLDPKQFDQQELLFVFVFFHVVHILLAIVELLLWCSASRLFKLPDFVFP